MNENFVSMIGLMNYLVFLTDRKNNLLGTD